MWSEALHSDPTSLKGLDSLVALSEHSAVGDFCRQKWLIVALIPTPLLFQQEAYKSSPDYL